MSITYYYAPMSTAVRTTWAVEELGVPCERRLAWSDRCLGRPAALKTNNPG